MGMNWDKQSISCKKIFVWLWVYWDTSGVHWDRLSFLKTLMKSK